MHLNKDRLDARRHAPKAVEAINLSLTTDRNTSGNKFLIKGTGEILISNQETFGESLYPYRNRKIVDQHIDDLMQYDILKPEPGQNQWIQLGKDIRIFI